MFDLKKYLWTKRMTSKEFAKQCGVSVPTLKRVADRKPISRKPAEKIVSVTGCSIIALLNPKVEK